MLTRRFIAVIAPTTLPLLCVRALAADTITVTIAADDSEIITTDLKRIRPAEAAELRFRIVTPFIAQTYGADLAPARNRMRLIVIATTRRVLGGMTGAQATGPEGPAAVVKEIDRALADMGVTIEQFELRYVPVQAQTP